MSFSFKILSSRSRASRRVALASLLLTAAGSTSFSQSLEEQRRGTLPASPWSYRGGSYPQNLPTSQTTSGSPAFVRQPKSGGIQSSNRSVGQPSKGSFDSANLIPSQLERSQAERNEPPQKYTQLPSSPNFELPMEVLPGTTPMLMPPIPNQPNERPSERANERANDRPSNLELQPAYPDATEFTQSNPYLMQRSGATFNSSLDNPNRQTEPAWETLPKNGLVLVGDPRLNMTPSSGGLPDRANSPVATSTPNPNVSTSSSAIEWQAETLRVASEQKQRISSQVSGDILREADSPLEARPTAIEPPSGWQSVEAELKKHLSECDELLRRGAVYSGRQEALVAIRLLLRSLDQRRAKFTSEPYFDQALVAFREEVEFHASMQNPERTQSVEGIVRGHLTPVLKGTNLTSVPPAIAAQHYQHFAKDRLIAAAESHPWAADLYYALGKCIEKQAEERTQEREMLLGQAAACYQAALATRSGHSEAANQLGFVLLQLDRSPEAEVYLGHSIQTQPTLQGYKNLAELYRRQGNANGQNWATNQVAAMQIAAPSQQGMPSVREVDPATFATLSPRSTWGNPASGPNPAVPTPPLQAQQTTSSSWFGKLFK